MTTRDGYLGCYCNNPPAGMVQNGDHGRHPIAKAKAIKAWECVCCGAIHRTKGEAWKCCSIKRHRGEES